MYSSRARTDCSLTGLTVPDVGVHRS